MNSPQDTRLRTSQSPRATMIAAILICVVALIPFFALFLLAFGDSRDVWLHLVTNVLPRSLSTTLILIAGVGILSSAMGVGAAWLVSRYEFTGRRTLQWALVLPLAVPTYISAYCFTELMDFTGPAQTFVRFLGGYTSPADYWFPDIRSLGGAIFIMSIVLYPYVYLTSRIVFEMQASSILEASRVLGAGAWRMFFRIGLPLARPAIAAGAMLAILEALNDIGAVEILGVQTLTFSIFDTWLNRSSLAGAAQIAWLMLIVVAIVIAMERRGRGGRLYEYKQSGASTLTRVQAKPFHSAAFCLLCLAPVIVGFIVPAGLLFNFALRRTEQFSDPELLSAAANSITVSLSAAIVTVLAAFMLITMTRRHRGKLTRFLARLAALGYAVPGSVLAIGSLYAFTTLDNWVDASMRSLFGISTGLLVSGSAAIIVYACSVRFLAVAFGSLEAGYSRISSHMPMAARTLGRSANQAMIAIELPLMKKAILTALLLVFVETMKELSATVLLRPFNFSTLATYIYERASLARFEDAAIAALAIVAIGLVPLLVLNRIQSAVPVNRTRPEQKNAGTGPALS
ncbi:MAG: iron ABC transporter permease [Pseudomonadota bacterium]